MATTSVPSGTTPAQPAIHPDTRIGHVHLKVSDLPRAIAFYRDAFGFELMETYGDSAAFLSAGGYHHHLGVNTWARGAEPAGESDARLVEWELLVPGPDDAAAALASLAEAGAGVQREAGGGTARDPWGVGVRIREAGAAD